MWIRFANVVPTGPAHRRALVRFFWQLMMLRSNHGGHGWRSFLGGQDRGQIARGLSLRAPLRLHNGQSVCYEDSHQIILLISHDHWIVTHRITIPGFGGQLHLHILYMYMYHYPTTIYMFRYIYTHTRTYTQYPSIHGHLLTHALLYHYYPCQQMDNNQACIFSRLHV